MELTVQLLLVIGGLLIAGLVVETYGRNRFIPRVTLLIGLGVLLFASLISRHFELYSVDWLIQSFWTHIVIAIIVLFQPEIRW